MQTAVSAASAQPAPSQGRTAALTLAALGVVYGDIGTSPLYTIKEIFSRSTGVPLNAETIIGAVSPPGGDLAEPMLDVRLGQKHLGQIGADVVRVHVPQPATVRRVQAPISPPGRCVRRRLRGTLAICREGRHRPARAT